MATTSVVLTVVQAIVALLQADPDLAGVDVRDARPAQQKRETIYFYGASATHEYPVRRAGRQPRDETCELRFAIDARAPGQSPTAAYARALALYGNVEDAIANDPTLGGVVSWATASGFDLGDEPGGEGWDGVLLARIAYTARLT